MPEADLAEPPLTAIIDFEFTLERIPDDLFVPPVSVTMSSPQIPNYLVFNIVRYRVFKIYPSLWYSTGIKH